MPWARIDDGFHGHPKVRETSIGARGIFATALSYCANYLTDGHLPATFIADHARGPIGKRALNELVERGWFSANEDGSYAIVGYLEWNPSRDEVEKARGKERRKKAEQRAKGRQAVLPWAEPDAAVSPGDSPGLKPSSPSSPLQEDPHTPASGGSSDGLLGRVKAALRDRLPDYVHETWIAPVETVSHENGTLTVSAPADVRGWIRERYLPLIAEAATELEGRPVAVVVAESDEERSERIRREAGEQRKDRRAERALRRTEPGGTAA